MSVMAGRSYSLILARLMWALPLLLLGIMLYLIYAGLSIRTTLQDGIPLQARVVEFEAESRAEITYGHIELEAVLPSGEVLRERLPMPLSLLYAVEGRDTLSVRVRPGAEKPMVIEPIARAQWRMSLIHASFCLVGFVLLVIGVGGWNRYLTRQGDPADLEGS